MNRVLLVEKDCAGYHPCAINRMYLPEGTCGLARGQWANVTDRLFKKEAVGYWGVSRFFCWLRVSGQLYAVRQVIRKGPNYLDLFLIEIAD